MTKKITIDDLAVMIQRGFEETARRSDLISLTERVDRLEERLEYGFAMIDKEFQDIKEQLKEVGSRAEIFDLQMRMDKIEKKIKEKK